MTKQRYSFYRPHDPAKYGTTGELYNPVTGEFYTPPSMTKQEFAQECDINNIIKMYSATGMLTHVSANALKGVYTELPDPIDYQESLNITIEAQRAFSTLPSKLRNRFENDPEQFLAFMADPANQDEAIALGLASRKYEPAPKSEPKPRKPAKAENPAVQQEE